LGFSGYDKLDKRIKNHKDQPFIFNHFEVIRGITTKTNLVKSLKAYYENNEAARLCNYSVFDTHPTAFVIARAQDDREI
jgi:hypothetical protein